MMSAFAQVPHYHPSAESAKKLNKNKFKYNGHSLVSYILFIYICFALSADSLTC